MSTDDLVPVACSVIHNYVIWVDPSDWQEDWHPTSWQMAKVIREGDEPYIHLPGDHKVNTPCAPGEWDYEFREAESWELSSYCEHRILKSEHCQPCMEAESAFWAARRAAEVTS